MPIYDNNKVISRLRKILPNIIAKDILGVQSMNGPVGRIFSLRANYGTMPSVVEREYWPTVGIDLEPEIFVCLDLISTTH